MTQRKPYISSTYTCQHCGAICPRKSRMGSQPKWCGQKCSDLGKQGATRVCQRCGVTYFGIGKKYCSRDCTHASRPGLSVRVEAAYQTEDWAALAAIIREHSALDEVTGCWIWTARLDMHGYPTLRRRKSVTVGAHRVSIEAAQGALLGSQFAHHKCANSACVNPDHLQPVTHADNVAEMHARGAYVRRIKELERALREVSPEHPLLKRIPVAT